MYEIPPPELNMYHARFFFSGRRRDGSEYEPETLREYFGSFARPFVNMAIGTTLLNQWFSHRREVLMSKRKQLKSEGKGNRKRKTLAQDNFIKLRESAS